MHAGAAERSLLGGEDAELVALGIGQHHPGLVALTDVDVTRPEGDDAVDLGPLVVGPEVEVDDGTRLADGRWLMSRNDSIWVVTPDSLGRAYIAPGHSATFTH